MSEVIYDKSKGSVQSTVVTDDGHTVRAMNVVGVSGAQPAQVEEMPTATPSNVGKIVQYVGDTTEDYTKGYFYESYEYVAEDSSISISQYQGAGVTPSVDKDTFETQITTSGVYDFTYDGSDWKLGDTVVDLADYGITYTESEQATASYTGTGITGASVVLATFKTQVESTGEYIFEYDGSDWKLGETVVDLTDYGITYTVVSSSASASQTVGSDLGTVSVNGTTFATAVSESGTYDFVYDGSDWKLGENTVDLTDYGISYTGASVPSSATASQTTGSSLSDVAVNVSTFETQITTAGSYVFTSDGTDWYYDGNVADLADYGITYTGTPVADDAITVVYTEAVVVPVADDTIEVVYVAEGPYANDTITINYEKGLDAGEVLRVDYTGALYGYAWRQIDVQPGGSVDYAKTVQRAETMPTADSSNAGQQFLYSGESDATYTHGYIYENVATTTSSSASAAQTVGSTLSDIAVDLATLESFTGWTTDNSLQIFYTADGWSVDTTSLGVTYTGTPNVGDAITITYTAESTTYDWTRIDVQPGGGTTVTIITED